MAEEEEIEEPGVCNPCVDDCAWQRISTPVRELRVGLEQARVVVLHGDAIGDSRLIVGHTLAGPTDRCQLARQHLSHRNDIKVSPWVM